MRSGPRGWTLRLSVRSADYGGLHADWGGTVVARYRVIFEGSDEDGYSASSPDLPGVAVAGATQDEARRRLLEAIAKRAAIRRHTRERAPERTDTGNAMVLDHDAA